MRIAAKELAQHLKRSLSPLYFVFGEDALQLKESIEAIRLAAEKQGFLERFVFEISEWDKLLFTLKAPSLFAEKRLLECRLNEGKLGKIGSEAITQLLNSDFLKNSENNVSTILLFTAGKIEYQIQSSAWFSGLERQAVSVCANPLSKEEMLAWLKLRTQTLGLQLSTDAIHAIFENTESNCLAASQLIEKLGLLYPQAFTPIPISLEEIQKILEFDARFSLFDLVDAALQGSLNRTTKVFSSLKNEGIDPILVLWALTREVRKIIPLARQIKAGHPEKAVFSQYGVWRRRETIISQCIRRLPISSFHQILLQAKHIDDILKGRLKGNGWAELRSLYLVLAGVPTGVPND